LLLVVAAQVLANLVVAQAAIELHLESRRQHQPTMQSQLVLAAQMEPLEPMVAILQS
jgi:hypothetical protein